MSSSLSDLELMSQTEPLTLKPLLFHSRTLSSSCAWLRAHVCTVAPSPASSSTVANLQFQYHKITNVLVN